MSNQFRVVPLDFVFEAVDRIHFPQGKLTNVLRGALGLRLRKQICRADCSDSRTCPLADPCLYQQLFEGETGSARPSGYNEAPRPFVLRSPVWDEIRLLPGERMQVSLHLFDPRVEALQELLRAFGGIGEEGLGPGRARMRLIEIRQPHAERVLWLAKIGGRVERPGMMVFQLDPVEDAPVSVRAKFLAPTEIKAQGVVLRDASFERLFARLRERLIFLIRHYGGECACDDSVMDAARRIVTVSQRLESVELERHSTRTGQDHPLSGFVGEAHYTGDFSLLWQWLKASEWAGIGRQTVWGKGAVRWEGV